MSSLLSCCNQKDRDTEAEAKAEKAATRKKHLFIKHFHFYGVISTQIMASSILIAILLWPFIRFPEPQVHLRGLEVEGLDKVNQNLDQSRPLVHYNMTIHNPDLYKSLRYTILVLRITFSKYRTRYGTTVTFEEGGQGVDQGPRETMRLPMQTFNYTDPSVLWDPTDLISLRSATKASISLWLVIEAKLIVLSRVVAQRQMTRKTRVYFDDAGNAFIDRHRGLLLH